MAAAAKLPDWLDPLYGAEQMRAIDRWAIEERGIPSLDLMERAGAGLALTVDRLVPRGPVAIVCGKGNNGGDGFVAGRLLRELGRRVRVLTLAGVEEYRGDAAENLRRLEGAHERFAPAALDDAAVIVDAIFGTGFDGEPRAVAKDAIESIAVLEAVVVSADVPSGVDASTGAAARVSVRATATATFAGAKPGHWIAPGKQHTGELRVIDIGIPAGAPVDADVGLIASRVHALVPGRGVPSTKFSSGHVVVAGGSRGLTGAPCLACEAAMRAGAGYVTALVPGSLEAIFEMRLLEVMTRGLPDEDGSLTPAGADAAVEAAARAGALVLGPGAGRDDGAFAFVREVAARATVALLLDADGLNAHAGALDGLAARAAPTVLTPHAGELGRLLGRTSREIEARRLSSAREAARRARAIVVLKGDDTIVAAPDGTAAVNGLSAPALATAGTGDVLGGVIAALLAKGLEPFAAACAGVRRHAAAGRVAAAEHGMDGVIARDVIAALPRALAGEHGAGDAPGVPPPAGGLPRVPAPPGGGPAGMPAPFGGVGRTPS
ncbi:MAG: ADP-dependent NAD(P)H-hydrate dehydratase / NAD(P)H-hydrate epimerase [Solirubrobacteraceae bacterium]|nr:ADP-dependent NAD(P)H-hydrate dehydratase / NAD(P)H-hydrate epimerase [Solirubrobacteraceae bacterium]